MHALFPLVFWLLLNPIHRSDSPDNMAFQTYLSATNPSFSLSAGEMNLFFTVSNETDKPLKFCKYGTPFEGFTGDILEITDNKGRKVDYTGIMVKRGEPGSGDFLEVPPKTMITTVFSLRESYPISKKGKYVVRFPASPYKSGLPESNALEISVRK